jgi:hypothetical protein
MKSRFLYWFFTGLLVVSLWGAAISGSLFEPVKAASSPVPMTYWNGAPLPDWGGISFGKMPGIGEGGAFDAPADIRNQLGYDPSRSWQPGDTPVSYLKLGDFESSLKLQDLSLIEIASDVGLDLNGLSLDSFETMSAQTLGSLVEAIPDLADFKIAEVAPVWDLLKTNLQTVFDPQKTLGEFLTDSPHLADRGFENSDLSKYGFGDIPGIEQVQLGAFRDWRNTFLEGVPGLGELPFNQFPNPPQPVGSAVGIVDVVFGPAEQNRERTISGSDQEGFSVPCQTDCAHVELSGDGVLGRQWVSGKFQEVKGGFGVLGSVNGGMEPVGRHPFGDAFKVVVWDVSETEGRADTALFFRFCQRGMPDLGCTPYFIGPIPWISYREGGNDAMFLGALDTSVSTGGTSTPTGATSNPSNTFGKSPSEIRALDSKPGFTEVGSGGDCSVEANGVKLDALSSALSSIEGNYDSVGVYTCSAGDCGRALGALQFMSYRADVKAIISSKPGGEDFLKRVGTRNGQIGEDEVLDFFPPQEQEALFRRDALNLIEVAAGEIDPTTGRNFEGNRLVERVAQMHFGGQSVPVDSDATDAHGRLSVRDYGRSAASYYDGALVDMGC